MTPPIHLRRGLGAALLLLLAALFTLFPSASPAVASPAGEQPVTLTLFWGQTCPKCKAERAFLEDFGADHPRLEVVQYEVWNNTGNRGLFKEYADRHGIKATAVPATFVGERAWVGWTDAIEDDLREVLEGALRGEPVPAGVYGTGGSSSTCDITEKCEVQKESNKVDVPLVGSVELADQSLVVSTLVIGFVDGINPCSLWAISILLAIVLRTGSRRRVLAVGTVFLLVTAGMYAVYMAGIYSALSVVGFLDAIQVGIAVLAGVFGLLSVKDYFWFRKGATLSIPEARKPALYKRMRSIALHRSLLPALAATTALAVAVSLLETPCTAGFPVMWTGMLAARDVPFAEAAGLYALYMIPFLIDEFLVFCAAVVTMRAAKLQEKHGRLLKLLSGTVMLALAGVMVTAPEVMEDVVGATVVFLGALLVAVAVHLVTRGWIARKGADLGTT
ncbi:hypothetical protein [Streptomyces flavalbus]|uniref:Thioredoxin domain-containing protein n=1 Tax=Streptomyces flavalbus TaxID=2665155 RepID=A0ABW2WGR0_9ACTN